MTVRLFGASHCHVLPLRPACTVVVRSPRGRVGDRHLVTVPQGVVGDRLPWGGERQGGGGPWGGLERFLLAHHIPPEPQAPRLAKATLVPPVRPTNLTPAVTLAHTVWFCGLPTTPVPIGVFQS